jgi:hypothetical protein
MVYRHFLINESLCAEGWKFTAQVRMIVRSESSVTESCTQVSGLSGLAGHRLLFSRSLESRNPNELRVRPPCGTISLVLGAKKGIIARPYTALLAPH